MSHEMVFCTQCGKQIHASIQFCPHCGATQPTGMIAPAAAAPSQPANVAAIPEGVKGWSWGAFVLNWIWAIGNKTWIGLLALLPVVNIVLIFVLGFKGREWAWKNNTWRDLEHFNQVQRKWNIAGFIVLAVALPVGFAIAYLQDKDDWSMIKKETPVTDKRGTDLISFDELIADGPILADDPKHMSGSNYGLSYNVPKLAFEPKELYAALKRNDLVPFVPQADSFLTAPSLFIANCVNSGAKYSRERGGLSEKEAIDWGINTCKQEIQQYQQCLGQTELEYAVACFQQMAEEGD